jgi:hypothetical protein
MAMADIQLSQALANVVEIHTRKSPIHDDNASSHRQQGTKHQTVNQSNASIAANTINH